MSRDPWSGLPMMFLWTSVFVSTATLSASLGYVFGERALSVVSSPMRFSDIPKEPKIQYRDPRTIPLLNEAEIIQQAKKPPSPSPKPSPSPTPTPVAVSTPQRSPSPSPSPIPSPSPSPSPKIQAQLTPSPTPTVTPTSSPTPVAKPSPPPIALSTPPPQANPGKVSFQVLGVQQQGGEIVLNVALQNRSSESARFLYSFMQATDERGRPLSITTSGLPGEVPPNGQVFQGTVRIPSASLRGSRSVSLVLTDYPARKHQLVLQGIPIP